MVDGYQVVGRMDILRNEINRDIARSNRLGLVLYSDATRTLSIICNGVLFRPSSKMFPEIPNRPVEALGHHSVVERI